MHVSRNLVLALCIGYDFLAFKPKLLWLIVGSWRQLVVRCCASKTALLRSVSAVGILPILQVKTYLVKAFF